MNVETTAVHFFVLVLSVSAVNLIVSQITCYVLTLECDVNLHSSLTVLFS